MKPLICTAFLVAFLLTSGSIAAAQTHVSVEGYWYPVEHHYIWHDGYYTRPPYPGARWVAARYDGRMFFEGYWVGSRGRVEHDHRWDGDHDRDHRYVAYERRGPGKGRGRGR
jgi:hypothetical protein